MIRIDEQALICDLAETYQIYDYKSLPAKLVAIFSVGLRENSRIKMKMAGMKAPIETVMLATITDAINATMWAITGGNKDKPPRFTELILEKEIKEDAQSVSFNTPESFEAVRKKILEKGGS